MWNSIIVLLLAALVLMQIRYRQRWKHIHEHYRREARYFEQFYYRRALRMIDRHYRDRRDDYFTAAPQTFSAQGDLAARHSCMVYRGNQRTKPIKLLKELKYGYLTKREARLAAMVLAAYLAYQYDRMGWDATLVVSVPSSLERLYERGYNQAELLAHALANLIGLPYKDVLYRNRQTGSQLAAGDEKSRLENVKDAFIAVSELKGQRVLLVDDVSTTGATLMECAKALKAEGAIIVWGLTLASGRVWKPKSEIDVKVIA